jgi:hypothetical protein
MFVYLLGVCLKIKKMFKILINIAFLAPYIILSQIPEKLIFHNDCMTFHVQIDSNQKYELYTTGDGGKHGSIIESGYVTWEYGEVILNESSLTFLTKSKIEFSSMIELNIQKTDNKNPEKQYFEEYESENNLQKKKIIYWEIIDVKNNEFYDKIIQNSICK